MSSREERLAKNEAFFREANEILEEEAVARVQAETDFVCECSRLGCVERLAITLAAYERVRTAGDHFVVVPGHEDASVERVIEIEAGYLVVEKTGVAGDVARDTDPR
jgi:hypothetical protein